MAPQETYSAPIVGSKTMKAVRFHGERDLRYEDLEIPKTGKGQVKIRPAWVGICGTDLHEYLDGPNICPTTPHPITGEKVPLTLGHEFSGVIEEVGEGVHDYRPGDRVVVQPIIYDGTCGACLEGLINCCYSNGFIGLSGWGGGLAEHIVVRLRRCTGCQITCHWTLELWSNHSLSAGTPSRSARSKQVTRC